ncbi:MAG TPA: type II toxin-antitoxin system VapC family toxin [Acidimicrobiales bacterium]|nr:type II toxin-antitoxin system VapC family toxin [Acidimicrobiales bacterium]
MILLDTNVLSALMRSEPDPAVLEWLDAQPSPSIWTTSTTVFEVRTGLDLLSPSRRRRSLEEAFEQVLESDLDGRVLAFDVPAARAAGALVAERQLIGRTIEVRDAQIAGIARAHRAKVATRNTRHFQDLGLSIVDPWS